MAGHNAFNGHGGGFFSVLTHFRQESGGIRKILGRRKSYEQTVFELSALSDRSLTDLGIPRTNIRQLAREAADDL
ncbi:DUF1127 domain-containing protein [Leisingera sp.]|uniref:DUF1127 domain-containing protein n=1 Tax=Leisingera sp. TaxID=1879318 RepID=UPI002B26512A|nr:DUF1127 domain-containing protein [Leisingera sp.]